jgi:hypothetical protein
MLHGTGTGEGKADMLSDIDFHRRGKAGHEGGGGKRRVLEPVDVQAGAAERQGAWWRVDVGWQESVRAGCLSAEEVERSGRKWKCARTESERERESRERGRK